MSTRGPKPKPSRVSELQGNPGKRAPNRREPKPATAVKKPYRMSKGAQKFWRDHASEMERISVLTGVDSAAFRLMAEHYTVATQAVAALQEDGLVVEGKDGKKKNPLAQIFKDNSLAFKSFATEFGMTPSSRTRLKVPEEAEQLTLADELFMMVGDVVVTEVDEE